MSEAKFTPGPWCKDWVYGAMRHISKNVDYDYFWTPSPEDEAAIDAGDLHIPNVRINHGDASLICAAPALYAACQAALALIASDIESKERTTKEGDACRAALALATPEAAE